METVRKSRMIFIAWMALSANPDAIARETSQHDRSSRTQCEKDSSSNNFDLDARKSCIDTIVGAWTGVIASVGGRCSISLEITRSESLATFEFRADSVDSTGGCLTEGKASHAFDISNDDLLTVYNYEHDMRFFELYDSAHLDLFKQDDDTLNVDYLEGLVIPETNLDIGRNFFDRTSLLVRIRN